MYWRLKALAALGVRITLHVFQYRRPPDPTLRDFVEEIHYYPRRGSWSAFHPTIPHIVFSRRHPDLLKHLNRDDAPILFEGLHTTSLLGHPDLSSRIKAVRLHNIEHEYYRSLALQTQHPGRQLYYQWEAARLGRWEHVLAYADVLFPISASDAAHFSTHYSEKVQMLPFFQGRSTCTSLTGTGEYALYHGNLSVPENSRAASFLVKEVFAQSPLPLIIAGKDPPGYLQQAVSNQPHIRLLANPTSPELEQLIQHAQMLVLPAMQASGMKGKLLESLLCGRHVIVNPKMVGGTGLHTLCHIASDPSAFAERVRTLAQTPFRVEEIEKRNTILFPAFDAGSMAAKMLQILNELRASKLKMS